jgi:hypothetical protein
LLPPPENPFKFGDTLIKWIDLGIAGPGCDEDVDLAVSLTPSLGAGGLVVDVAFAGSNGGVVVDAVVAAG